MSDNALTPIDNQTITDVSTAKKLSVVVNGQEHEWFYEELGLSFNSTEQQIMDVMIPIIREQTGEDMTDLYKVRKTTNNENIFIFPNSTAGK